MNCDAVSKNLALFLYGELSLEEEQALQDHLDACTACGNALQAERAMQAVLDRREVEVPPALLARCRRDLEARVEGSRQTSGGWLASLRGFFNLGSLQNMARPAGAVALVALGFFGARWSMAPPSGGVALEPGVQTAANNPVVTRVRYLQPESSGQVRLMLEETTQRYLTADPSDQRIYPLLLAAVRESSDPGVRADSMEILNQRESSDAVRDALLHALQYDSNPGVRLRALSGLKQYAQQPEVRQVLARSLLEDENPGVRTQAIDLLVQFKEDSLVGILQQSLQSESNSYVRLRSERALKEMNASVGTF